MANIFDKNNAALMSFGKVMSRMAAQPLDISEIWYDYDELETYAASDATAYAGQKVTYVDQENNKVYQYSIQTDGTLKEIGVAPTGDEASITVSAEGLVKLFGYSDAETGTIPMKDTETGKLIWKTLEDIGAGDGNDNTTYTITALEKGEGDAREIYGITIQAYFNGQAQGDAVTIAFDVYTKSEADAKFAVKGEDAYDDTELAGRVKALEDAGYQTADDVTEALASYATTESVNTGLAAKADKEAYEQTVTDLDALEAKVDAFLTGTGATDALDSLQELIEYINTHDDVEIASILEDIQALENKLEGIDTTVVAYVTAAIEALKIGDYAKAADLTALASRVEALEAKPFDTYATKDEVADVVTEVENKGYAVAIEVANTYATKTDVANTYATKEYIGTIPTDAEAINVIAYINEKAQEVLDSATGGSSESAASVKQQLDTYKAANDPKVSALLTEVWGSETYTGDSRLDAHDTAIASNTTLAQKGVDDAEKASQAVNDLASGQVATNKNDIATLTTNFNNIVTAAETGLVAKVAALETADTAMGARVTALEAKDTSIEETLGEHTNKIGAIESKDNELALLIQGNTNKFANYYTKTEAEAAVKKVTGEVATDTTLVAMIGAKADQATTYTKTEVNDLFANFNQVELEEGIQANANAIAILVGDDANKSVRTIASEEVAKVVDSAPEAFDTLKEIAEWITNDETGTAAMSSAIAANTTAINILNGDKTTAGSVDKKIADAIAAIPAYDLPAATAEALGGVKLSDEIGVNDAGQLKITKVTTDVLENGVEELILFGGDAKVAAE